ncbi:MAG: ArsA family ATPase [Bdellovibrionota bacterium]
MIEGLFKSKILICAGSGGVGKTTVSSTLAYKAAEMGKKVLVFTIDPSKRLATCLGLDHWNGNEILVKKFDQSSSGGELWAAMIEPKKIFDEFVHENSSTKTEAQTMLDNRLYQELSTSLSGSQEFTSLQALNKAFKSGIYDLIVLDTPPAQHTLDFIQSPEVIFNLFKGPIVDWFMKIYDKKQSGMFSFIGKGTAVAINVLERLTGAEFISELQVFFATVSGWREAIQKTVIDTQNLMMGNDTQFVIVTNIDDSKLLEAEEVVREFKKRGFQVHHIIINKVLPEWTDLKPATGNQEKLISFYNSLKEFYSSQIQRLMQKEVRGFRAVEFWSLPQITQEQDELMSLEKLSKLFKGMNFMDGKL